MGLPKPRWTIDEYLTMERAADERHEYLDGDIFAMAGESVAHGIITVNLVIALGNQLKGKPCQVLTKDTKVRSGPDPKTRATRRGLFSYPDLIIVCGEQQFHDEHKDVLLNPTAIIEVLSETTEAYDRGEKFMRYQTWLPSMKEYVLVRQDEPQIERYTRQESDWSYLAAIGLAATMTLDSVKCELALIDVYDRIAFENDDESE